MKRIIFSLLAIFAVALVATAAGKCVMRLLGEGHSIVTVEGDTKYILLPVQDNSPESRISVINDNNIVYRMNVRLAKDKVDYFVPYSVNKGDALHIHVPYDPNNTQSLHDTNSGDGIWMKHITCSDSFTPQGEKYRPSYHFAPTYGWMNDPNGMFWKDGVYHLYYQYNPFGAVWGNMSWGHATSTDLVHWKHEPVAMLGDGVGAIFSGSAVVDKENCAGFGKDAIVAFYTSADERQTQSMAHSTDNGMSFVKYPANPILTSQARDFRDPKVIWHAASQKWIMCLAVGQEMQFFSSTNLKDWSYESSFGAGEGCHGGVWECPDLVNLPVEGTDESKWVLFCNINPGGPFGGSATQYFVGDFDGSKFTIDTPGKTRWVDYGKDHYAAVTWSNVPDSRCIAIAWMSNWQYAGIVPTKYFRSANSLPRELSLYSFDGELYIKSAPVKEITDILSPVVKNRRFSVSKAAKSVAIPASLGSAFNISLSIDRASSEAASFSLVNNDGDTVIFTLTADSFAVDRTKSGKCDFSDEFACVTSAPINSTAKMVSLSIYVDNSSIEVFGDNGRFVLTNLVFPQSPFNKMVFASQKGKFKVVNLSINKINL